MMAEDHGDNIPASKRNGRRAETSFILRIWLERSGSGPPALRGTLADLDGSVLGAFGSIETLSLLIRDAILGRR
jgi:hypothetical protein